MVCWSGKVAVVVLWTRRTEEPLAERREVAVGAREKISAGCAVMRGLAGGWRGGDMAGSRTFVHRVSGEVLFRLGWVSKIFGRMGVLGALAIVTSSPWAGFWFGCWWLLRCWREVGAGGLDVWLQCSCPAWEAHLQWWGSLVLGGLITPTSRDSKAAQCLTFLPVNLVSKSSTFMPFQLRFPTLSRQLVNPSQCNPPPREGP